MSNHLITTKVLPGRCPRCRTLTLIGYSEGLLAKVDITPLDMTMEKVAIVLGRWTYSLLGGALVRRVGGRMGGAVLAEHVCGSSLGTSDFATTPPPPPCYVPPF